MRIFHKPKIWSKKYRSTVKCFHQAGSRWSTGENCARRSREGEIERTPSRRIALLFVARARDSKVNLLAGYFQYFHPFDSVTPVSTGFYFCFNLASEIAGKRSFPVSVLFVCQKRRHKTSYCLIVTPGIVIAVRLRKSLLISRAW